MAVAGRSNLSGRRVNAEELRQSTFMTRTACGVSAADDEPGAYSRLVALFLRADTLYNSGLFRFATAVTDSLPADRTALSLRVGDEVPGA